MKKRILARALMMLLTLTMVTGALALETPATQSVSFNSVLGSRTADSAMARSGMLVPVASEIAVDVERQTSAEEKTESSASKEQVKLPEMTATSEVTEEEQEYPLASELDLFSLDWKAASEEEINHYLGMTDWAIIGQWLVSMEEQELEELLARDTVLVLDTIIEEPDTEPVQMLYYEYAMQQYYAKMRTRAAYPVKASGYWTTQIVKTNAVGTPVQTASITFKISGIDTTIPIKESQKVTIAKSITGNWCDINKEKSEETFWTATAESGDTYPYVHAAFSYSKPAGYRANVSYSLTSSFHGLYWHKTKTFGKGKIVGDDRVISSERFGYPEAATYNGVNTTPLLAGEYNGRHYLIGLVNMYKNAGIGTTSQETKGNLIQTITLSPINYNVSYNGNGCTGGSVSAQNCTYDVNYTTQPNGFQREYTVTYNGNGGSPSVASQKALYTFKGWGLNQKSTVNYAAGSTYKNLTNVSGGAATMYALWNPTSIILPAAIRAGYRFGGWNIGNEGAAYTPTSNITAVAKWNPNTYTIRFQSAGGSACEDVVATYDKGIMLPVPEREGYNFNGWKGSSGMYFGNVKNLSEEHDAVVTLVADWSAITNVPYTIRCFKQPSKDIKDKEKYVLFQLEKGDSIDGEYVQYGTTDETVSVVPMTMEGYATPAAQNVQIAGDGSTVVNFYYDLKTNSITGPSLGANGEELEEIAKRIAAGLSFSMDVDGVEYEIGQAEDGTLGIKFISTNAEKITIPDVITINKKVYRITEIQEAAFKGNQKIKEVELSANISKIGASAFEGCQSLKKVVLREGLVSIGSKAFSGCTALKSVKLPSTVQSIGNNAFQNCKVLSEVVLNEGLLKIGNKSFFCCPALVKISIPKTVLKIGKSAFAKCKKLKTVKFIAGSNLLSLGSSVFSECGSLGKIKLPSKLTAVPSKTFYKCKKLKNVTIGKSVTKIGANAFAQCKKISKITIPSKVQNIDKMAFYKCTALKKVTIKSKALTSVGSKAFVKCKKGIIFVVPKDKKDAYSKLFQGKY